ncbi:non-histone chromosomal protein HMG-like isoform X1 [Acanthopagrus latus]|uniref:non-histone chromosomal protein HMG-like isoform X1 n=1 Tax=Acanthopagrus latus TaxID=8177 RepID=UPI00187C23CE|nr:non-histone chromosomal protein HMG-like isoform X1 [Acanthopagrus latus]
MTPDKLRACQRTLFPLVLSFSCQQTWDSFGFVARQHVITLTDMTVTVQTAECLSLSFDETDSQGDIPKRRSLRLKDGLSPQKPPTKAEAKPKPKKAPAKPKKAKEVEKAKPEEKAPEAPAENGEAKAEEEAPATDAAEEKDEAAE